MKRFFSYLGFVALICISFIFTEKTMNIVKETDELMIKIKEANKVVKQEAIDAIIENNTIIPGQNGVVIDEEKSYQQLRKVGEFNENLLKYKTVLPNVSISDNYDKYVISGNKDKKDIALIFLVRGDINIENILNKINNKNIKVTFFVDSIWLENNNDLALNLINQGHNIGNLSYNFDYKHGDFIWVDMIVRKIGQQKTGYCYTEQENIDIIKICATNKNYTIIPNLIVSKYPSLEIKENIKNGSIVSLPINGIVEQELDAIINYIYSKGFAVQNLENLLSEEI